MESKAYKILDEQQFLFYWRTVKEVLLAQAFYYPYPQLSNETAE
jgi:hypothetical protein